ncbi:MAG: hypothetical protein DPW09_36190 [Anaerolineae bacterium]|nr:hypothetical protein [Anaerolineales bacterium]MCQ3978895.1 hypothetical protein [Anaerolineae bacterium]
MATRKPQNEIVVALTKDRNDCIIVTLFDVHGDAMKTKVAEAGFEGTKFAGKEAIKRSGAIVQLMKKLNVAKKHFVANGHNYWSCTVEGLA